MAGTNSLGSLSGIIASGETTRAPDTAVHGVDDPADSGVLYRGFPADAPHEKLTGGNCRIVDEVVVGVCNPSLGLGTMRVNGRLCRLRGLYRSGGVSAITGA